MADSSSSSTISVSFVSLLGAVLVVLKVLGMIQTSWFWVLAPFWIPATIVFAVLAFALFIYVLAEVVNQ